MSALWQWPAFDLRGRNAPERLQAGRAVWGKVHGADSDFRWIAFTPGLDPQERRLERDLLLGSEDSPETATSWRALETGYFAVSCYPSQAVDAARRSGFLEKQLLEWTPEETLPAALGALTLLPRVADFDDTVWWKESGHPGWHQPGFSLTLAPPDPIDVDPGPAIERGRTALRDAVDESALAGLYSALLAGRRSAFLSGLERPLPPAALAALLLPLPREIADRLSIAGWVVSQRLPESFSRLWNVLVCNRVPAVFRDLAETGITDAGRAAARALLEDGPGQFFSRATPEEVRQAEPARAGTSAVMDRLLAFATEDDRRWLGPDELAGDAPLRLLEGMEDSLAGCVQAVQDEISRLGARQGTSHWQREHLQAKADLLRAAALALAPRTVEQVGLPGSERIPALLFCPRLHAQDWDRLGRLLGEQQLSVAIDQSLSCKPGLFSEAIRSWLESWRGPADRWTAKPQ